jgi:hypothetical protein
MRARKTGSLCSVPKTILKRMSSSRLGVLTVAIITEGLWGVYETSLSSLAWTRASTSPNTTVDGGR